MISLVEGSLLLDTAFSDGGAVHRAFGSHRPEQREATLDLWGAITAEEAARAARPHATLPFQPYFRQIATGLGKSLILGATAAAFTMVFPDRRVIVSAHTNPQRDALAVEVQRAVDLLTETAAAMGLSVPIPTIATVRSATQFADPLAVEDVLRMAPMNQHDQDCLDVLRNLLVTNSGAAFPFSDYFSASPAGRLPFGLSPRDLDLSERIDSDDAVEAFARERRLCQHRSINLVTGAMLLANARSGGALLGTGADLDGGALTPRLLLNDEAHALRQIATSSQTDSLLLRDIDALSHLIGAGGATLRAAVERLRDVCLREIGAERGRSIITVRNRQFAGPANAVVAEVHAAERLFARRRQETFARRANRLHNILTELASPNTSPQAAFAVTYQRVSEDGGEDDVEISKRSNFPEQRLSVLWHPSPTGRNAGASFHFVAFVSAVMSHAAGSAGISTKPGESNPGGDRVAVRVGLRTHASVRNMTRRLQLNVEPPADRRAIWGSNLSVRGFGTCPLFVLAGPGFPEFQTSENGCEFYGKAVVEAWAAGVIEAHDRAVADLDGVPNARVMVLVSSDDLLCRIHKAILEARPDLAAKIVTQRKGAQPDGLRGAFEALVDGIWLGVAWEGFNAVDAQGLALAATLVIPKLPYPPLALPGGRDADAARRAETALRNDTGILASEKMVQGLGRVVRSGRESVAIWILDARMPHPSAYAQVALTAGWSASPRGRLGDVQEKLDNLLMFDVGGAVKATIRAGRFDGKMLEVSQAARALPRGSGPRLIRPRISQNTSS